MARKDRKVRKKRGSNTHGKGKKGSRKKGGGKGAAGSKKHQALHYQKKKPGHFKEKKLKPKKKKVKTINLEKINDIAHFEEKDEIDTAERGYDKVLGKGKMEKAVKVKGKKFSEKAEKKIEEAGGEVVKDGI